MTRFTAIAADWRERLAAAGLRDPADLLAADAPDRLGGRWEALRKPGLGGRQRWRWQLDDAPDGVLYLKHYERTALGDQLDRIRRQCATHSRAWWEFHQSGALTARYVPVVRAVGVAEEMRSVWERRSAVLFAAVAGDAFDRVWPRLCAAGAPVTRGLARHELVRALARFVSAFHQTGFCHRDLYLCHVFADLDGDCRRPPNFTLIDLGRTHRPVIRRQRWLIKDLSQLDCSARQIGLSRADRLRGLVAYLGLEGGAARVRWYARKIVRKSDGILRRSARRAGRA